MRKKLFSVVAGLVMAATMASSASAAELPICVGTEGTIVVCVDPTGALYYADCVYLGEPPCTYVYVYGPTIDCSGRFGAICDFQIGT